MQIKELSASPNTPWNTFLPFQTIWLQFREDYYYNVTLFNFFFSTEYAAFYLANHVDIIMKQKYTLHWVWAGSSFIRS